MAKLTRDQIRKGLETVPMEQILQGASGTVPNLSAHQIEFAKQVALGATSQSEAYRKVYSKGNSTRTVNKNASVLANDARVKTAIEAFKTAQAYSEYQTPSQLRALVVSQLTKHILDEDFPPAQRVQCLKLLGGVAEVGLFLDRKESIVIHKSDDIKARLLDQLKTITGNVEDITPNDDADSLLDEIQNARDSDPTVPVPPECDVADGCEPLHTIPLKSSSDKSIPLKQSNKLSDEQSDEESIESTDIYPDTNINNGATL